MRLPASATMLLVLLARAAAGQDLMVPTYASRTLPFVEEQLKAARELMGEDFWSYGVAPNRHVLDTFLRHHHGQGLSPRRLVVDDLFHPSTLEAHRI